jgi:hypothetical protein
LASQKISAAVPCLTLDGALSSSTCSCGPAFLPASRVPRNDPGVSGTALRMSERALLMDEGQLCSRPDHKRFADKLASALAHNLMVADLDYGCKGENRIVLNLNRLPCSAHCLSFSLLFALDPFLKALPKGFRYAIEIRNENYLTREDGGQRGLAPGPLGLRNQRRKGTRARVSFRSRT